MKDFRWELNTFPFKLLILSYNKKSSRISISETIATCLFFDHFLKPFLYFSSYTVNRTQPMKYKIYTKKAWDLSTPLTVWKCFCVQFLKGSWNLDCHWKLMALLKNRPKNFFKSWNFHLVFLTVYLNTEGFIIKERELLISKENTGCITSPIWTRTCFQRAIFNSTNS